MTAAGLIFGVGPSVDRAMAAPRFRDYPFKLGVASGDPRPDGVVLWTRLAPNPLAESGRGGVPRQNIAVRWEVATDEGFRRIVRQGSEVARPELGHSVHAEVRGLAPKRPYFYRFKAGSETSPVGRTKTTPPFGAYTAKLSFAFASCQQYEHGYFGAFRRLAQEDLDLVVHLGDYIYEYGPNEYRAAGGNVRVHNSGEITTLAAYRNRHAQYRGDRDLQRAHAAHPWVVTWDDHEVENNYADEIPEQGQSPEAFLQRRANAYQAYYEHVPLRRSSVPRGPDMRLYRRLAYGNLAEFNVLDTRQYRDDQANGDGIKAPSAESEDPNRTLTGDRQERWLLDGLADLGARWNVLAQQVFFAQRDFQNGAGQRFSMDSWDGYPASRERPRLHRPPEGPEPDRAHRRRSRQLGERHPPRLRGSGIGGRRGGVRGHVDHLGWRRVRRPRRQGGDARREPTHQVLQQPARLRTVHADAEAVAGRLPRGPLCEPARGAGVHTGLVRGRGRQPGPPAGRRGPDVGADSPVERGRGGPSAGPGPSGRVRSGPPAGRRALRLPTVDPS